MSHTDHARRPRQAKTPAQRASERLALAQRAHAKAEKRLRAAKVEHDAATADEASTAARLQHAQGDPDLPPAPAPKTAKATKPAQS